ncbi:holo-ACP synthase [Gracilibacillus sp. S3-1-1]|uniref:Holo-ACP synthase n=1 Tax=Gracilibacillus pellucidus TaxID=3095368 RepID=A0ACC6M5W9_9BACI|nr:holo-ACP synthase [Gracilibacillus sp. S3-1-1]MDX8046313.1 holo-ACP synthase [Gracilibacillus sp. S3-1-1]
MIKGIGVDIIELRRIRKIMERQPKIINRILTVKEKELLDALSSDKRRIEFIAGRFAAKEAFSKARGTGIGKLRFRDIEITNHHSGAPILHSNVLTTEICFVSISHSEEYAVAQVIIESEPA